MSLAQATLLSEPYAPTGNIGDSGIRKLLGTPSLTLIQTLVREAVQNSCDAASLGIPPNIQFRLRTLTEAQLRVLRDNVLRKLPPEKGTRAGLEKFLKSQKPVVLEIDDFGTTGLNGPTRADRVPSTAADTNFLDFFRNVGTRRDVHHGGGTYGFGKIALYLASRCWTIVVDTKTKDPDDQARRFMACHLGASYSVPAEKNLSKRYTGRHWWGDQHGDVVEPLTGADAVGLSEALGLPARAKKDTGTSIMILDPVFAEADLSETAGVIAEAILWFFWPRMLSDTADDRRIRFRIEVEGREFPIPSPEKFPPLDLFSQAMRDIRKGSGSSRSIDSRHPAARLGTIAIAKGLRASRTSLTREGSLFPAVSSHIAVMRPVEFVVRYFEGPPLPDENVEWAGAFVVSGDDEVEQAFASAEPPAHDDWQPTILPKGRQRTFVNVAVREILKVAREVAAPSLGNIDGGAAVSSLAAAAGTMGRLLLDSVTGQGAGRNRGAGAGGGGGKRKQDWASAPAFARLEAAAGGPTAVFETFISRSGSGDPLMLEVEPALALEGGSNVSGLELVERTPRVVSIRTKDGRELASGGTAVLGDFAGACEIHVTMPADSAVTLSARLERIKPQ